MEIFLQQKATRKQWAILGGKPNAAPEGAALGEREEKGIDEKSQVRAARAFSKRSKASFRFAMELE